MREHYEPHMRPHCQGQMHVRNGRTNEELLTLITYLTLSNAHGGAEQNG